RRHQIFLEIRYQLPGFRINHCAGTVECKIELERSSGGMRGTQSSLPVHCIPDVSAVQPIPVHRTVPVKGDIPKRCMVKQVIQVNGHMHMPRADKCPLRYPVDELVGQNLRMNEK